jgi:hypothetical protein
VEDGSLPSSGFEINSAPAFGDAFIRQIVEICAALNSEGAKVTEACGYHVHVDARDLSYLDVQRVIRLYAKIESALFSIVPPSRRTSHYCSPCGERYLNAVNTGRIPDDKKIEYATYGSTCADHCKRSKYHESRYAALNLHSWFFRGTLECRMAAGTAREDKVICWALLWANIIDWSKAHTDKDIEALPHDAWECLLSVAPTAEVREWLLDRRAKFAS